jgi:hypothetical protein
VFAAAYKRRDWNAKMSQTASQYAAFWRDVKRTRMVWTVRDAGGVPAPKTAEGTRAMPFWSSLTRVQKIIRTVPAYRGFAPHEVQWDEFRDKWLPDLASDGYLIGVNWSGPGAKGYDISPADILKAASAILDSDNGSKQTKRRSPARKRT